MNNIERFFCFDGWLIVFMAWKLGGTSLAAWSWGWVLLPFVPILGALIGRSGL